MLICIEVKQHVSKFHRYLETLKHEKRLNVIKKGPNDNFRGCKTLSNVQPMYLEVKFKKPTFD